MNKDDEQIKVSTELIQSYLMHGLKALGSYLRTNEHLAKIGSEERVSESAIKTQKNLNAIFTELIFIREKTRWVPVEQTPKVGGMYWVSGKNKNLPGYGMHLCLFRNLTTGPTWEPLATLTNLGFDIEYWQPLPAPPEQTNG